MIKFVEKARSKKLHIPVNLLKTETGNIHKQLTIKILPPTLNNIKNIFAPNFFLCVNVFLYTFIDGLNLFFTFESMDITLLTLVLLNTQTTETT